MIPFPFDRQERVQIVRFFRIMLQDRYLGSALGVAWAVINPLFMMALFTFIFGFVFKARLPGAETSLTYVTWLISGYAPWLAISESLTNATGALVSGNALVKNLVFKPEVLPLAATLTGFMPLAVGLVFLIGLLLVSGQGLSWHLIYLPLVVLLQMIFMMGLGLMLSALAVFMRDLLLFLPSLLMVLMFATPIFYPAEALPEVVRGITAFNPFFIIAEGYRQPLIWHQAPDPLWLLYLATVSLLLFAVSLKLFRRVQGFFDSAL